MAAVAAAAETVAVVSPQIVGNAFVQQYYHILHHSPELVFRFYQDESKLGRPEEDGSMSITTTMEAINDKIVSLNYGDLRAEIKTIDAQESFSGGVSVLVTGYLTGKDNEIRNFSQSFFLAPQDRGYFVLNDMFRYLDTVRSNIPVVNAVAPSTEPNPPLVQENHTVEHSIPSVEEPNGEVVNPVENGDVPIEEEEVPVAEVVNEVKDDSRVEVESNTKVEEVPKKSYAKIVIELKENGASFSPPPAHAPRKPVVKNVEQVNQSVPAANGPDSSGTIDTTINQEAEGADCYSIYLKGLPMTATVAVVAEEFKKFGPIKNGGIQVRSNRGFCFGFVEFEEASSVQKAMEASPIPIGGRQVVVEEKRSTNSRGSNRRFLPGRGSGFINEGARGGRGNYGGGRGYNRGEFNPRNDYSNRGGNRGGSSNRGGEAYHRVENGGSRMNRGMSNGTAKTMAPRVSATA